MRAYCLMVGQTKFGFRLSIVGIVAPSRLGRGISHDKTTKTAAVNKMGFNRFAVALPRLVRTGAVRCRGPS